MAVVRDMTADARVRRAEQVVAQQRRQPATPPIWDVEGRDYVEADDHRELEVELARLQRAVMGEPEPDFTATALTGQGIAYRIRAEGPEGDVAEIGPDAA